jgi:small redox-active disulfide protein 2
MKIEVLGTGCKRCEQLYENAAAAASHFDPAKGIEVVKVADVNYFTRMGVFMTPGLVIDGTVVAVGKVPTAEEIKQKIQERL